MWNLKCMIILVLIGATGTVSNFKEKFGSHTKKSVNRFTTKDSYTSNSTHKRESATVWNWKLERWGSLLVQVKYRGEKACEKRQQEHNNNNNNNNNNRCGDIRKEKCRAKGSGKEVKIQEFMYRDTTNVEPEMYDYTSNNWSHWNSNEKVKGKSGSCTRKTFDRFTTYLERHT